MRDTSPNPKPVKTPKPPKPSAQEAEGVRRQRQHIKDLTGEDPLRGGVTD